MTLRRFKKVLLVAAALCVALLPFVSARASKTVFYPEACEGDWNNVSALSGKADITNPDDINSTNASESKGIGSRVTCSHFTDNTLGDLRPLSIRLDLGVRPIGSTSTSPVVSRLFKLVTPLAFADEATTSDSIVPAEKVNPPTTTQAEAPTTTVATTTESSSTEASSTSFIASTTAETLEATSSVPTTTAPEISPTSTDALASTTVETATSTESILENATTTPVQLSQYPDIEIQSSFDGGDTWGFVSGASVNRADHLLFELPLANFNTGEDISKLSLRIIKTGGAPEVQIESVALSVNFVSLSGDARSIVLKDLEFKSPDFVNDAIASMLNVKQFSVVNTMDGDGSSLWVYEDNASIATSTFRIATSSSFTALAIKDGIIFWQADGTSVYGFRVSDHRFLVPLSSGVSNTGEVDSSFFETKWKVIARGGSIYFSLPETGEIAGDDDGSIRDIFYESKVAQSLSQPAKDDIERLGIDTDPITVETTR
jgi:hypothetical protein